MKIRNWQYLEKYLSKEYDFLQTFRSGAIFGDCDLFKKFGHLKISIEAKFSKQNLFSTTFKFWDFYKGLHQSNRSDVFVLAYGTTENILFFVYTENIVIQSYLDNLISQSIDIKKDSGQFTINYTTKSTYIKTNSFNMYCLNIDNFDSFIKWINDNHGKCY